MKVIFKKYGPIVLILFLSGGALALGYNQLKQMFFDAGMAAGKAEYQVKVDEADAKLAAAIEAKRLLAEKAGKDREDARIRHEDEMRKINHTFAVYKSRTADELQDKNATIGEVLAEKRKDEIVIVEAKKTIAYQHELYMGTLLAWKISEDNIEAANKEAFDAMAAKFKACDEWSKDLEQKLKPSFWKTLGTVGKYALAFSAGHLSGRIIK